MADHGAGANLADTLYYGDNLEILQRFFSDETVDLVYLDPPFNKNKAYSLIFRDESGRTSDAQLATFEDYWHWGPTPSSHYEYLTNSELHGGRVPHGVSDLVGALHSSIRPSPLLAYLVEMTTRLVELHRVLRSSGSIYLHCDPTASHYLKLILDAIFGPTNFRNEIIWKRTTAHSDAKRYAAIHDTLLYYGKSREVTWTDPRAGYAQSYLDKYYRFDDGDGRLYWRADLCGAGVVRNGSSGLPWRGIDPSDRGMHWKFRIERLEELDAEGRIYWPPRGTMPQYKRYRDQLKGKAVSDLWDDIDRINPVGSERIGYPTQKPLALLDRIIRASSNPGDLILDPFCGCGTAIEAAVSSARRWIGIDNSNLAVEVIRTRMQALGVDVAVFDWPTELEGVRRMVEAPGGRHRFEAWSLTRLGAQPVRELGGKGADQGIDGRIAFTVPGGRVETILVSVKSGHVGSPAVRDLTGTMQRERAVMGVLFTLQEPTEPMRKEAASSGFYHCPIDGRRYPRVVIHTVRDLLEGLQMPDLPSRHGTQSEIWQLPTSSRPVRLRGTKSKARSPQTQLPWADEEADATAATMRQGYIRRIAETEVASPSPAAPRSPRMSTRDR